jgi:hypothetical protein
VLGLDRGGAVGKAEPEYGGTDPGLEVGGRADLDHLAGLEDHDPLGQGVGLFEVLGGEQHGGTGSDELADRLPQREAALEVEPGGRLVQEQHRRLVHKRRGDVTPAHAPEQVRTSRSAAAVSPKPASSSLARSRARERGSRDRRPMRARFSRPVRLASTAAN